MNVMLKEKVTEEMKARVKEGTKKESEWVPFVVASSGHEVLRSRVIFLWSFFAISYVYHGVCCWTGRGKDSSKKFFLVIFLLSILLFSFFLCHSQK